MESLPTFPTEFLIFVESHTNEQPYEFDDVEWWIATREELKSQVNIDGVEYPYFSQLAGYVKPIAEFSDSEVTEDAEGNDYPFTRLTAGLVFAQGDGDVLYFDPQDDFSVWYFAHDGGDVERLANSFSEWLEQAILVEDD